MPGDIVRIKKHWHVRKGESKFTGPVEILQKCGPHTYANGQKWNEKYLASFYGQTTLFNREGDDCAGNLFEILVPDDTTRVPNSPAQPVIPQPMRGTRERNLPAWTNDYVMGR